MGRGPNQTAASEGPGTKGSWMCTTEGANRRNAARVRAMVAGHGTTGRASR